MTRIQHALAALLLAFLASCSYLPKFDPSSVSSQVNLSETRRTIELRPKAGQAGTGLMFYPGGLVDSHVYDILLGQFAGGGNLVVVAKMQGNFAFLDIDAGANLIPSFTECSNWVLAGHSLGGSMAASAVKRQGTRYAGLILMDAYPADGDSLAAWPGAVLLLFSSIEKTNDAARLAKTLSLLPPATWLDSTTTGYPSTRSNYTVAHLIPGGRHSYFGSYGPQDGDATPTTTEAAFHAEVLDYMNLFFSKHGWR